MTKIERAEKAIDNLKQEGKLSEEVMITSMTVTEDNYLDIFAQEKSLTGYVYYEWREKTSKNSMICFQYFPCMVASCKWDEEEGRVIREPGLTSLLLEELEICLVE